MTLKIPVSIQALSTMLQVLSESFSQAIANPIAREQVSKSSELM